MSGGNTPRRPFLMGLRMWLVIKAMEQGATYWEAEEAVATTMLSWRESPDPNLRTYDQWEKRFREEQS